MDSVQYVAKDCGKHYGLKPGPCSKCSYFHKLESAPEYKDYRAGLQYDGTPWIAVLGEEVPRPDRTMTMVHDAHHNGEHAMPVKTAIRYRVTVNGETAYRNTCPTEDDLARIESFVLNRGGHARVDECHTTVDPALLGTGRGVSLSDKCIFEIEG